MKTYKERKNACQSNLDGVKIIRAFSKEQLEENAYYKEAVANGEKLYSFLGWLITKPEYEKYKENEKKEKEEREELTKSEDFVVDAMKYELNNHEFCYDRDFDVFEFLGLKCTPENMRAYTKAKKAYFDELEER